MRTGLFLLLVCLTLASSFPSTSEKVTAQTIQFGGSGSKLIQAFQAVQKADDLGAPRDQVVKLTAQLNSALGYYNTAIELSARGDLTGSEQFLMLSNNTSTIVTAQALILQNQAENDKANERLGAYSTAIVAAVVSALFVLEYHQIPNFFRKRRILRTRVRTENSQ